MSDTRDTTTRKIVFFIALKNKTQKDDYLFFFSNESVLSESSTRNRSKTKKKQTDNSNVQLAANGSPSRANVQDGGTNHNRIVITKNDAAENGDVPSTCSTDQDTSTNIQPVTSLRFYPTSDR